MGMLRKLEDVGIIPVITIENAEQAAPLGKALVRGGLPVAEVTFRTKAAADAIARMRDEVGNILVGAGTILTVEQADEALASGAEFIFSPGINEAVVKHCQDKGVLVVPGVATPSEIELALRLGLEVVKFFPAEAYGGLRTLKSVSGPYGGMRYIPTGGISLTNVMDYLSFDKVLACGGSWMASSDLIGRGKFSRIEELAREAAAKIKKEISA